MSTASTRRLLVYTRAADYRHESTERSAQVLSALAAAQGVTCEITRDPEVFCEERLADFSAISFFNTSGNVLSDAGRLALEAFVRRGGGFLGVHAAAATEHDFPFYTELVGATFSAHPEPQVGTLVVEDRDHPATRDLPERFDVHEEWYGFSANPRDQVRVLLRVDETSYLAKEGAMGSDHPIAWCHTRFQGRSLYTALGHATDTFAHAEIRKHFSGAIAWVLGLDEHIDTTP
jgi:type 1 glutamine amidotransferase